MQTTTLAKLCLTPDAADQLLGDLEAGNRTSIKTWRRQLWRNGAILAVVFFGGFALVALAGDIVPPYAAIVFVGLALAAGAAAAAMFKLAHRLRSSV